MSERLDQAHDQWVEFVEREGARLLIWEATGTEPAVIEAFVARESEPDAADTPDLFVQLTSPFAHTTMHGFALAAELVRQHEQVNATQDAPEPFPAPQRRNAESDVAFLLRFLTAFRAHLSGEEQSKLAVWLSPREVVDRHGYLLWLQRLVHDAPDELRFFVIGERGAFEPLIAAEPGRVVRQPCDFDVADVAEELNGPARQDPGSILRRMHVAIGAHLGQGELDKAVPLVSSGTKLAIDQGWPHVAAMMQLNLGAGYAQRERWLDALRCYVDAERFGGACEEQPTPDAQKVGPRIRLSALLSQGSALLAQRAFKHAAELYLRSVALAQALADLRSELDGHRLASFCYSELGEEALAWQTGMLALACAAKMDEQTRKTSSLGYLLDHQLRMTKKYSQYTSHQRALQEQAVQLLGPDWKAQLPSSKAS